MTIKINTLQKQKGEVQGRIDALTPEITALQRQLDSLSGDDVGAAVDSYARLSAEVGGRRAVLGGLQRQLGRLRQELEVEELAQLTRQKAVNLAEIDRIRAEILPSLWEVFDLANEAMGLEREVGLKRSGWAGHVRGEIAGILVHLRAATVTTGNGIIKIDQGER